jgi:hypothetical protein
MSQNVRVCGFTAMIEELEKGKMAWRKCDDVLIFKQIPAEIPEEFIKNMKSLPEKVKEFVLKEMNEGKYTELQYVNQYVALNRQGMITYYTFSGDDINANDWVIMD